MNTQSGKTKVESRFSRDATHRRRCVASRLQTLHTPRSPFRIPHSDFRLGLTLIELLVTITIIATLSAAFLGASQSAMEAARAARTKTTIGKIHGLLMEQWASYATRRVDVDTSAFANLTGQQLAEIRLAATRSLMKLEMPDRWSDLLGGSTAISGAVNNALPGSPAALPPQVKPLGLPFPGLPAPLLSATQFGNLRVTYPSLAKAYLRRYNNLTPPDTSDITKNQGAECLYMIIMLATGDGEARTFFGPQDIGDTDGDGAPEFLDGWGQPIQFIRWPAGFALSSLMSGDPDTDHDSFDHFRRDLSAYRLVPLIYSAGPDAVSDLVEGENAEVGLAPYLFAYGTANLQMGTPYDDNSDGDENWHDNIHNHLQDNR
ncbi:MAG: prepilin-type N-terminal cleavage/methylation domain-containing protein [Planctomycetes bacterium]|nr:prepilin-type N-terminal cleavage/methylation domain-containing protein [Planctomycetota bacterium]